MAVYTHKRPELRAAVVKLLDTAMAAIRDGGQVPLADVVLGAAGSAVKPAALQKLHDRGIVLFEREDETTRFQNIGPRMSVRLERFSLVIPARISGQARLVPGGIDLSFHPAETFSATKYFFGVHVARIEATSDFIFVGVQGGLLDQRIDLV